MNLEERLLASIKAEAMKLIQRYQDYHNNLHLEHERKKARMQGVQPKLVRRPAEWAVSHLHDPFYVHRRAASIAKSISRKIIAGIYAPNPPFEKSVRKKSGGSRKVSVYQIPDAAVSKLIYTDLLAKNKHRFSAFSYAYRNDRNVHFAIQDIAIDLEESSRTFVAEFDFSDFFGSISHSYLLAQFDRNGFMVGRDERQVIEAFLRAHGTVGIPQGTSASLFLANMVCWELDKKLERCGVKFARYADDTVIWSPDYSRICDAFSCIDDFSRKVGVQINVAKSAGISLLKKPGMPAEMQAKDHIDFLGYSLSVGRVSIKQAVSTKIKSEISYILSKHLLQPLRSKPLKAVIIPSNNRDRSLIAAMSEIRRYLYGGLTSDQILNYIHGRSKRIYFKGLMSYYPLINDLGQLKELDGWLVATVFHAVRERSKLLLSHGYNVAENFPFVAPRTHMVALYRAQTVNRRRAYELPSFTLLYQALTQALTENGIERVMNARSISYVY
jgi:retron-type reverse transcriptase